MNHCTPTWQAILASGPVTSRCTDVKSSLNEWNPKVRSKLDVPLRLRVLFAGGDQTSTATLLAMHGKLTQSTATIRPVDDGILMRGAQIGLRNLAPESRHRRFEGASPAN